jgi:hypothetical protein
LQAAELQEKLSKTLEENQKLQEKLLLLSREKQATDKKVTLCTTSICISKIIVFTCKTHQVMHFISY